MNTSIRAYTALAAVCIIWGTTYLALRIAVLHFPPLLFTAMRQVTAGGILLGIVLMFTQTSQLSGRQVFHHAIAGFFMIAMGNGLVAWAEMEIPSGIAAIICSLMPIVVIAINITIHRDEKPTPVILTGMILGLAGIVIVFSEHLQEFARPEYITGIVLILLAVIGWAAGSIWVKRLPAESNPFMNAGLQMLFGGLWLLPLSLLFDDYQTITWTNEVVYPLIYLIVFGSIIAYASYFYALRMLPMTIVSLYAYVNPLVAVLLGWVILNEKLNTIISVGILVTLLGIYIVNFGYRVQKIKKLQFSDP